ncbi:MAG: class I SAM-dependent methyltransferase [Acidobacteria bacterium]|nr:class I SAM-dependent methyltransferase [Acidobacteriota bacterium]
MDLVKYRQQEIEGLRTQDLLRLLPKARRSILEIGARDGHHSRLLAEHFQAVTALDLEKPAFAAERVTTVKGDVTALEFPDNAFDSILCAEVLEHVPAVERAAAEITRVVRYDVLIGVPCRQDTRVGKMTCRRCGRINPCCGHVHSFDEQRIRRLFGGLEVVETSFVGVRHERTNPVSCWLMNVAGNPWGTYDQVEGCVYCGARMEPPASRTVLEKAASRLATRLDRWQQVVSRPTAGWIHVLFRKPGGGR